MGKRCRSYSTGTKRFCSLDFMQAALSLDSVSDRRVCSDEISVCGSDLIANMFTNNSFIFNDES